MSASYPGATLLTGSNGMLGSALRAVLDSRGHAYEAFDHESLDITKHDLVESRLEAFAKAAPSGVVVNAAAYTDVQNAEKQSEVAFRVNEQAPAAMADTCSRLGLSFAHISTDFVFDGSKGKPYVELDQPRPLNVYGQSKWAGEQAVLAVMPRALIVRTSWVYGPSGVDFPSKMLELAARFGTIRVADDEVGSPTFTYDLARGIVVLVESGASGVYHLAGEGGCTRFELAEAVIASAGAGATVLRASRDEFAAEAERPLDSRLDSSKAAALGVSLPAWRDGVARCFGGDPRQY